MKVIGYSIAVIGFALMLFSYHIQGVLLQPERRFPNPEAGQTYRVEVKGVPVYALNQNFGRKQQASQLASYCSCAAELFLSVAKVAFRAAMPNNSFKPTPLRGTA